MKRSEPSTSVRILGAAVVGTMVLAASACGDPYENGRKLYQDGEYARALDIWMPLADRGDKQAQFGVGYLYDQGLGVPEDTAEAARWYRLSAEQGHVDSQYNLALLYSSGREGVTRDLARAADWYLKAAQQGKVEAQSYVGRLYYVGQGLPKNYDEAFRWLSLAAEEADQAAMYQLGLLYSRGVGVEQSVDLAVEWLTRAGDSGLAAAQKDLAMMYARGDGVNQDRVQAMMWLTLHQQSVGGDLELIPDWAAGMTDEEIGEARSLAELRKATR